MIGESEGEMFVGFFQPCQLFTPVKVTVKRRVTHTHTSDQLNSPEVASVTASCPKTSDAVNVRMWVPRQPSVFHVQPAESESV